MFSRQGIGGDRKVESAQCPAGQREAVQTDKWIHGEEGKQLEPGDWLRIEMNEKGTRESGEKDRLLMDLEREEEKYKGRIYLQKNEDNCLHKSFIDHTTTHQC